MFILFVLVGLTDPDKTKDTEGVSQDTQVQGEAETAKIEVSGTTTQEIKSEPVDSIALYNEFREKVRVLRELTSQGEAAFRRGDALEAVRLLSGAAYGIYVKGLPAILPGSNNPAIQDAWEAQKECSLVLSRARRHLSQNLCEKHWRFVSAKGTMEREMEFDILGWFRSTMVRGHELEDFSRKESLDERGYEVEGYDVMKTPPPSRRIVKNVKFSNGTLTASIRLDMRDIADISNSEGTLSLKHPLELMSEFRDHTYAIWGKTSTFLKKEIYKDVDEIQLSVYFPGAARGTETVILKVGLDRSAAESADWGHISSKDGTFQDLMKERGTYLLSSGLQYRR